MQSHVNALMGPAGVERRWEKKKKEGEGVCGSVKGDNKAKEKRKTSNLGLWKVKSAFKILTISA